MQETLWCAWGDEWSHPKWSVVIFREFYINPKSIWSLSEEATLYSESDSRDALTSQVTSVSRAVLPVTAKKECQNMERLWLLTHMRAFWNVGEEKGESKCFDTSSGICWPCEVTMTDISKVLRQAGLLGEGIQLAECTAHLGPWTLCPHPGTFAQCCTLTLDYLACKLRAH